MQLLRLVVEHRCPFSEPLREEPGVRVTHLCHRGADVVLELHAVDVDALRRIRDAYGRIGGELLYEEPERPRALVRFPACACCAQGRVIPTLERSGNLYLPPSTYEGRRETYQFLAAARGRVAATVRRLPRSVVVAQMGTKPLANLSFEAGFFVPLGALVHGVSDRQRQAMVAAILRGYYRRPRAVSAEALARDFGVSRAAFDVLLRKAENKLATTLFPYLAVGAAPAIPLSSDPARRARKHGRRDAGADPA